MTNISNPDEYEKIAKILRRTGKHTEVEVRQIVDLVLQLAPELIKIWSRVMLKHTTWTE
jgi:SepF-like predicted cell division protein (DUF552 family)